MARNGSGTMSIVNTFVAGNTITAAGHNQNNTDIAAEITNSVAVDGQSTLTGQLKAANGTVAAPSISFGSDLDSGLYRIGANNIGLAVDGTKVLDASTVQNVSIVPFISSGVFTASVGMQVTTGVYKGPDGTVSLPTFTFANDLDCGSYRIGANNIGYAVNGAKVLDIATTGLGVTGTLTASTSITATTSVTATTALSGATAAGTMIATQAEQETGSAVDKLVTPGRQQSHASAAKAWIYYIYSAGTPTSQRNFNVSSLTDNGTGDASINFTTAFSDTAHTFNGNSMSTLAIPGHLVGPFTTGMSATLMRILAVADDSSSPADNAHNFACFFGDQ